MCLLRFAVDVIVPAALFYLLMQDASSHDGDWGYYKQRAYEQKDIIGQLKSLLETYGYHLPAVSG